MGFDIAEPRVARFLDTVYDAAVSPHRWSDVLSQTADLFGASFVDLFTRSHDRQHFSGLAHGLDRRDYEDVFLGFWFKRNIWAETHPVRTAGEVISTRAMVDIDTLRRTEIYNEFLHVRGLHEGLRLSLWVDDREIHDISILRPWSGGAFGRDDIAFGTLLLPHLQRAAAVSRRLRDIDFVRETSDGAGFGTVSAFAFDAAGRLFWFNPAAEGVLAEGSLLRLSPEGLEGPTAAATREIRDAVSRAVTRATGLRTGGAVALRQPGGAPPQTLVVLPASNALDWTLSRPPAAIALLRGPLGARMSKAGLRRIYPLTDAEADLALELAAGRSLGDIATRSGRSRNTLRTHLARLMGKTKTNKQSELVKLLCELASVDAGRPLEPFALAQARAPGSSFLFSRASSHDQVSAPDHDSLWQADATRIRPASGPDHAPSSRPTSATQ